MYAPGQVAPKVFEEAVSTGKFILDVRPAAVIDMRDEDEPLDSTIPNSYHIAYNEIEDRLDEVGCRKTSGKQWDCSKASKVIAFCYGPMCLQIPAGIRRMVRMGFPVQNISYYRGGMMDWEALGLTTVTGNRSTKK